MYRALSNLSTGKGLIQKGQTFPKRQMAPTIAEKLLAGGKIAEVNAPPLSEISAMKEHLKKLKKASLTQADAFVDADPHELVDVMKLDEGQISALQNAVCRALDAPDPGLKG